MHINIRMDGTPMKSITAIRTQACLQRISDKSRDPVSRHTFVSFQYGREVCHDVANIITS